MADEPEPMDVRGRRIQGGPLPPEEAERLVERLRKSREYLQRGTAESIRRAKESKALLEDAPLKNLNRWRRAEYEVVIRYLAYPDLNLKELASLLGYQNWRSVQQLLKKPYVQKMIGEIRAAQVERVIKGDFGAQALLKQSQVKAAQKVVDTIDDPAAGPKTNLAAAESVLDRTGLGKQSAVEHHHVHEILRHFTSEELAAYGNRGIVPDRFKQVFAQLEGPKPPGEE